MMNINDEEMIRLLKLLHQKLHQAIETNQGDSVMNLPPSLRTPEAMALWHKAQDAGYVDKNYQPLISRTQSAMLAFEITKRLRIRNKWKIFEELWHRQNIRSDYNKALNQQQYYDFVDELKKNLS